MIGKLIRERRKELGMTQEELAKRLGYKDKSAISKIEKDKNDVSQSNLVKISDALGVPPTYFIDRIEIPHDTYPSKVVMEYAKRLLLLKPENLDNVIKYIDFLESQERKEE